MNSSTHIPHILHLIDSLAPGGAERMVVEIANATDRKRFQVSVCITRRDSTLAAQLDPDIRVLVLNRRSTFDLIPLIKLARYCRDNQVSLLHVHMRSSLLLVAALQQSHILPGLPVIFTDHYGDVELHPVLPPMLVKALKSTKGFYSGVHQDLVQAARNAGIPSERIALIANAIDFPRFTNGRGVSRSSGSHTVGVMIANLRPTKNHPLLFRALASLPEKDWEVWVVGDAIDEQYAVHCRNLVRDLRVDENVHFLGARDDIPSLLHHADLGLLTSDSESGPLALLEYVAAGIPVVATRTGLIGHRLSEMGMPAFVEPGDEKGLRAALQTTFDMPVDARRSRGQTWKARVASEFDMCIAIERWHKYYMQALNPQGGR